jgi:hypothetical protein
MTCVFATGSQIVDSGFLAQLVDSAFLDVLAHKPSEVTADFVAPLVAKGLKTGASERDSKPNIVGQFIATCMVAVILSV